MTMSLREYARARGLSHVAVVKAVAEGRLAASVGRDARGRPYIADPREADREWREHTDPAQPRPRRRGPQAPPGGRRAAGGPGGRAAGVARQGARVSPQGGAPRTRSGPAGAVPGRGGPRRRVGGQGATLAAARARQVLARARREELDLAVREGRLVDADDVRREAYGLGRLVRDHLLNLPDRLAAELAAETDPARVHARLDAELRQALQELVEGGGDPARGPRRARVTGRADNNATERRAT